MAVEASVANMRAHYKPGVFAWSPETGEEYSADPSDYFMHGEERTQQDANGNAMLLVRRVTQIVDVDT